MPQPIDQVIRDVELFPDNEYNYIGRGIHFHYPMTLRPIGRWLIRDSTFDAEVTFDCIDAAVVDFDECVFNVVPVFTNTQVPGTPGIMVQSVSPRKTKFQKFLETHNL